MQKRKGRTVGTCGTGLPLTEGDLLRSGGATSSSSSTVPRIRRKKGKVKQSSYCSCCMILAILLGCGWYLGLVVLPTSSSSRDGTILESSADGNVALDWYHKSHEHLTKHAQMVSRHLNNLPFPGKLATSPKKTALPLADYPTLQYVLDKSELVGLYFAASWCPMSTPVTLSIDELLGEMILLPPKSGEVLLDKEQDATDADTADSAVDDDKRNPLSLVYVSSDRSEIELKKYQRDNWVAIPFDSNERDALKQHFATCAKPEMDSLGIYHRNREIPTLMILDGRTHTVLTASGAEDLKHYGAAALDHWLDLHRLVRGLEDKYA